MAGYLSGDTRKVTTHRLIEMKERGEKISMLTSYDYTIAQIVDGAGVDVILVGDSASNVMAGNVTTLPITIDQMIYHGKSVMRGVKRALVVVDMPFGSYQADPFDGVRNAIRIMKETGADALKLEGGEEVIDTIRKIIGAGMPVMGHLGLMPQSINKYGTYGVRAKGDAEAENWFVTLICWKKPVVSDWYWKNSCRPGSTCGFRTDHSGDWYRCRWSCRRTSTGSSRHAGYDQRLQSAFLAPLCRLAYGDDRCYRSLCG